MRWRVQSFQKSWKVDVLALRCSSSQDTFLGRAVALRNNATVTQCRSGGTRSSSVKLEDLPQGLIKADAKILPIASAEPNHLTVIGQARNNIDKFENCVVLTRVGGFYELYFEQADEYGPLLGLKIGSKFTSKYGHVSMSGFPFAQLDRYLKVLVQDLGKYVAISEEFPNDDDIEVQLNSPNPKRKHSRRVARVVTPGTLVDEKFMDPLSNNFCLAIHVDPQEDVQKHDSASSGGIEAGVSALNKLRMAKTKIGLAWVDLSTGEFFMQSSTYADLSSLLMRISPKEILVNEKLQAIQRDVLLDIMGPEQLLITWQDTSPSILPVTQWQSMLETVMPASSLSLFSEVEVNAGSTLLQYVKELLQGSDTKLQPPVQRREAENMVIDKHTLRGLEILETMRDSQIVGAKGSLLHAVRRTVTSSGARLLRDRITRPSTTLDTINRRLDLVEELLDRTQLRQSLVKQLRKTFDTQRLVQKFALDRGEPDDLVSISRTIGITKAISDEIGEQKLASALFRLRDRLSLEQPMALSARIANAIDEEGLIACHEEEGIKASAVSHVAQEILVSEGQLDDVEAFGLVARVKAATRAKLPEDDRDVDDDAQAENWIMRKNASKTLQEQHDALDLLNLRRRELAERMRNESGASTLSLRWTPSLGHFCHVRKVKDVRSTMSAFPESRSIGVPKSTRYFYMSEWTALGNQIDQTKKRIRVEEQTVFADLRNEVVKNLIRLRRNAAILDEIDVACSSATLAEEQNAVRPSLDNSAEMKIVGGRHPTVTLGLEERGRPFIANDCFMSDDLRSRSESDSHRTSGGERIHLVTGPNMAGKSTFLRQNALFAVMAQVGLYVPAAFAHFGLVDALFARIGSADNLYSDKSTFMTEMLETAHILRAATPRSLVVMDEVGRGTTPDDGTAVAFAALWHLAHINRCRTLFATHFHKLVDMTADWDAATLGKYCTDVKETGDDEDGSFVYLHKVRPGVNRQSHALKVAAMAGLPQEAMDVAKSALQHGKLDQDSVLSEMRSTI